MQCAQNRNLLEILLIKFDCNDMKQLALLKDTSSI